MRKLHVAASGFQPAITSYRFHPYPPRGGEIVSHGDLGPWNTVYRDGIPVTFIDWDSAQPVDPLVDLAAAAWTFVPLPVSVFGCIHHAAPLMRAYLVSPRRWRPAGV
jgi:aminoglycoside phosphotransferase (APT) family kinase protein